MIYISLAIVVTAVLAYDVARRHVSGLKDKQLGALRADIYASAQSVLDSLQAEMHGRFDALAEGTERFRQQLDVRLTGLEAQERDYEAFKRSQDDFLVKIHGEVNAFAKQTEERFREIDKTIANKALAKQQVYGR